MKKLRRIRRMKQSDFINIVRTLLTDCSSIACLYTLAGIRVAICSFSIFFVIEIVMILTSHIFVADAEEVINSVEEEV